jgi:hypothetical protein
VVQVKIKREALQEQIHHLDRWLQQPVVAVEAEQVVAVEMAVLVVVERQVIPPVLAPVGKETQVAVERKTENMLLIWQEGVEENQPLGQQDLFNIPFR